MNTNDKLRTAMKQLKKEPSKDSELKFIQELANSKLILPIRISNLDGSELGDHVAIGNDTSIGFVSLSTPDNKQLLPIFTSEEELLKWKPNDIQTMTIDMKYVATILGEKQIYSGVSIDPFGENIAFSSSQVTKIFGIKIPM